MSDETSETRTFKGAHLAVIQLLLVGAFVFAPEWRPLPRMTPDETTFALRAAVLTICGLVALVFGVSGFFRLGTYLTPFPYPVEHNRLITSGIYGLVRHPLYGSLLFAGFGWFSYTLSLSHLLLLIAAFFFLSLKANKEEQWMTERHPEYRNYAARVKWKFIPYVY